MAERSDKSAEPRPHPWSVRIATVAGIPIRLHFTFFLGLLYFGLTGPSGVSPASIVTLVLAMFGCVVLHELGHSLVALRCGIPVRDITLYPIGGVAMIEKRPPPKQELWIAIAGPAVNVVIALVLWAILGSPAVAGLPKLIASHPSATRLLALNIMLVFFNMIPAFPMDGGRVLRSILALVMPVERATSIAAGIGQFLAICLAALALTGHGGIMLMFIAFFVFVGAGQEATAYTRAVMVEGVRARQAMMTDVRTLSVNSTLKEAADVLLATAQHDFPVLYGDSVQGVLTRDGLLQALAVEGPSGYVAGAMVRQFASVGPEDDLADAISQLETDQTPVLVIDRQAQDKLLGIISGDNIAEFFALRRISGPRNGLAT